MIRRATLAAFVLVFAAACSGGGTSSSADTGGAASNDTGGPAPQDVVSVPDTPAGTDLVVTFDGFGGPDLAADADTGLGEAAFGEPCNINGDCESGICWATPEVSGCTIPCTDDSDCEGDGYTLQCARLSAEVWACQPLPTDFHCTDHRDCPYPYVCLGEEVGCALPECRFDSDCDADKRCNTLTRRCESLTCISIAQCTNPLEFCIDGACGPATCADSSECPEGQICSPTAGHCEDTDACDEEGNCASWQKTCVDGYCDFALCQRAILPGEEEPPPACEVETDICDEATGICMTPCTSDAQCGEDRCHTVDNWCYGNREPYAVAGVEIGGVIHDAADVPLGTTVRFDGTRSVEPDGTSLTYYWDLRAVPPGSVHDPSATIDPSVGARPTLELDARGSFVVDLVVMDDGGLYSTASEVVVSVY